MRGRDQSHGARSRAAEVRRRCGDSGAQFKPVRSSNAVQIMKEMKQMAPFSAQNAGSLRVIVPVVILAIGGLLLLGGQSPTKTPPTSAPTSTATILDNSYHGLPNPMTQPEATSIAVKRLAVRTHGDYDKLTYDEKMFLE